MLIEKRRRYFLQFDLMFRPVRDRGRALNFYNRGSSDELDVVSILRRAVDRHEAIFSLRTGDTVELVSVEVREAQDVAILLFRRRNPDAATQVFEHSVTKALRRADKDDEEFPAVSCHLFVKLTPSVAPWSTHSAYLEEVPGLGRSYVTAVLGDPLRRYKYTYTDHRNESRETHSLVRMVGVATANLGGALAGSALGYVELVRPGTAEGLDTEGVIVPREERFRLNLSAQPADKGALLRRITEWARRKGWSDVRVMVRMPEDRSRIVTLGRQSDAVDVLFVRSEEVNVVTPMDPCTDVVNEELLAKALELWGS